MNVNSNFGLINQVIPESKSLLLKSNHLKEKNSNDSAASNELVNADVFAYSKDNEAFDSTGIYSRIVKKGSSGETADVNAVQLSSSSSTTINYYDVIKYRAAKKAGATLLSNGSIYMPSQSASMIYQAEYSRIQGTFWCQTGGWSNLDGNGGGECARTASATMASINSGYIVTPNDTGSAMKSVTVNGTKYEISGDYAYNYSTTNGAESGFHAYGFKNESDLLAAINTELSNGRSVVVKVSTLKGTQHWVTVTGTADGKPAESFSDLIGVDPWYNGNNTANGGSIGTGNGACTESKSGVITLSTTCSGFRYSPADGNFPAGYRMVTFNVDN